MQKNNKEFFIYLLLPALVRPQLGVRGQLEIVLAETQDLELRQTSRDCAEHLALVLPKLEMIFSIISF